ncbi:MAG: hypothetical protein U0807_03600 [Candidatus Binatia bacterium]
MERARLAALLVAALAAGCAGGGGGGGGTAKPAACRPPKVPTVSFASNIQPIFTASCAVSSACHAGAVPAQGLDLSPGKAYGQTVRVRAQQQNVPRIAPGKPNGSYVVSKIEGSAGIAGVVMPIGCPGQAQQGQCLTPDQLTALRTWVSECALDN